ncbi:MAG: response regulator [Actinomycetia bacterium]|nr:response regulator [Actinomycetes bacterium]
MNLQVLHNYLAAEDFDPILASSGAEALRLLGEETFDLVLLDVMMPRLSGYEVCRALREKYPIGELPVLFLTAKTRTSDVVTGLALGANDYLTKPVARDELLARVRPHLDLLHVHRNLEDLVQEKMSEVKVLTGLLPICATCKKIRDDGDHWAPLETFIDAHSEAEFSHGLCPECLVEYYRKAGLEPPSIGDPT